MLGTNLIVFTIDQRQFEAVLCRVDGENARPALSVQAVNAVSSDTGGIDGQVQGPYDAMITAGTEVLFHVADFHIQTHWKHLIV